MISTEPTLGTKQRILDSAERLFAAHGVEAASLRTIIADARVNLAAIHYHYHSKDALLDAVLKRRLEPINRERLAMLDACGERPCLEAVLEAFIAPAVRVEADPALGGKPFVRLMGRIITEETDRLPHVIEQHFGLVLQRFTSAFHGAVPELPKTELLWRMHFMIGAVAHTLRAGQDMKLISGGACDPSDLDAVTRRLVSFIAAGFRAPLPQGVDHA
jgi:AcrR family transcriptional regulator